MIFNIKDEDDKNFMTQYYWYALAMHISVVSCKVTTCTKSSKCYALNCNTVKAPFLIVAKL
jgi:hypothetical protein